MRTAEGVASCSLSKGLLPVGLQLPVSQDSVEDTHELRPKREPWRRVGVGGRRSGAGGRRRSTDNLPHGAMVFAMLASLDQAVSAQVSAGWNR